jgi:hypothetical protein
MTEFAWDSVPHFDPDWADISGKSHMYKTARLRTDGQHVELMGVITNGCAPMFRCRLNGAIALLSPNQLCGFVL